MICALRNFSIAFTTSLLTPRGLEATHTITVIAKDTNQNEIEITQPKTIYPGEIPEPGPIIVG